MRKKYSKEDIKIINKNNKNIYIYKLKFLFYDYFNQNESKNFLDFNFE